MMSDTRSDQLPDAIAKCIDDELPPLERLLEDLGYEGDKLDAWLRQPSVEDLFRSFTSDMGAITDRKKKQLTDSIHATQEKIKKMSNDLVLPLQLLHVVLQHR